MITFIRGELVEIKDSAIVLDNNGIGYEIIVPVSVQELLAGSIGDMVKIHTYFQVREDGMFLFGFISKEDLDMFKKLITVNGIGPKAAISLLSAMSSDTLRFAILSEDVKVISKAPGIGAKTAAKLVLELKDKVTLEEAYESKLKNGAKNNEELETAGIREDAVQALAALGYSRTDALRAVKQVEKTENMKVEDVLKASLKFIG